jgi:FkbH-like protein
VASKNDAEDARSAFERREMPLRLDDFSAMAIDWSPKSESVQRLADDLNIGVDSLVMADDNPAERLEVAAGQPSVLVLGLPAEPDRRAAFLLEQTCFERSRVTTEDRDKLRQFREQAGRQAVRRRVARVDDYLRELASEVEIRAALRGELPRVHQLFSKTNQFNITTRRYSMADVERLWQSADHCLGIVNAWDRFGTLGLIGLYLLERHRDCVALDSFLLSCRALGRGIETVTMNALKRQVRDMPGVARFVASFVPTKKNLPARDFLPSQGLTCVAVTPDGVHRFESATADLHEIDVPHVKVTSHGG